MSWVAPKTNWAVNLDSEGNYIGDWINAVDFNRIKNNFVYLRDLAITMYPTFQINDLGADRDYSNFGPYADEINSLEENLDIINTHTINKNYGTRPTYYANGIIIDADELNRLESATLDIYSTLTNQYTGRRMLAWRFGAPNTGYLHGM